MRKVFLIIGIFCSLAAFSLLSRYRDFDSRSSVMGGWKAKPQWHGCIYDAWFSPDGKRLLFRVYDESGKQSRRDTYLYSLSDKSIQKLPISRLPLLPYRPWAPDSKRIAFYERNACKILNIETNAIEETFRVRLVEWSPDGKMQLFENSMTNDKYLRDVQSRDWIVLPKEVGESHLLWNFDCRSLLYLDWDSKNIMQYRIGDGTVTKLASLEEYGKRFFTLLAPSRHNDYVYFTTPRHQTENHAQNVILHRLDVSSGKIEDVFDSGLDQAKGGIGRIFLTLTENPIYYYQGFTGEDGEQHRSMRKLNINTGASAALLEGDYGYRDYSSGTDMFAVNADEGRTLALFDVKTKKIEQIFPTK